MIRRPRKPRKTSQYSLRVPRQVCLLYSTGKRLYAIPHHWKAMYDFLQKEEAFEVPKAKVYAVHDAPWGNVLKENVWVEWGTGNNNNLVVLGNDDWKANFVIVPDTSVRVVVTERVGRIFRY